MSLKSIVSIAGAALAALAIGPAALAADTMTANVAVYPGSLVAVPAYVGKAEGIYARHGLDVTLIDFRNAPEATAALFSGDIDLMSNSPGNMMLVNSRGKNLVNIVDNYPAPVWSIVVQNDLATPNQSAGYPAMMQDLKGKTIGVPGIGSDGHNFARRFLGDAGFDPEQAATFLAVGLGPDALAAFKAGQLDAVMAIEPVQSVLVNQGGRVLVDLQSDTTVPEFASWTSSTYSTTREHADENAEMMKRFQAAQAESIAFIRDPANLDRAATIWSAYNKALTVPQLRAILDRLKDVFSTDFNCAGTDNVGKFQVDNGLITQEQVQGCDQLTWSGATQYAK